MITNKMNLILKIFLMMNHKLNKIVTKKKIKIIEMMKIDLLE